MPTHHWTTDPPPGGSIEKETPRRPDQSRPSRHRRPIMVPDPSAPQVAGMISLGCAIAYALSQPWFFLELGIICCAVLIIGLVLRIITRLLHKESS